MPCKTRLEAEYNTLQIERENTAAEQHIALSKHKRCLSENLDRKKKIVQRN